MRRIPLGLALLVFAFAASRLAAGLSDRERVLSPVRDHPLSEGGTVGGWLGANEPGRWEIGREKSGAFRVSWVAASGTSWSWTETDDAVPLVEAQSPPAQRLDPGRVRP